MTENTVLCHLTQENALEKPGTRYHLFMDAEENPKNCMRVLEELHLDDYSVTDVVLQVFGDSGSSRSLFCYFLDNIPEIQCTLAKPCFWTSGVCRNLKISFTNRFYVFTYWFSAGFQSMYTVRNSHTTLRKMLKMMKRK